MSMAMSLTIQAAMVGSALLLPLIFTEALPLVRLVERIQAPAPPRPPAVQLVEVPRNVIRSMSTAPRRFYFPTRRPTAASARDVEVVGVPGAPDLGPLIPGALASPRGIVPNTPTVGPPPSPAAQAEAVKPLPVAPTAPIRIGGEVQAAMLLKRVMPVYPPLAKAARIQGTVRLEGIISKEGRIVRLQLVSGHSLLVKAAIDAVQQWIYKPTLLNGQPVEVIAPIDVHFTLTQ